MRVFASLIVCLVAVLAFIGGLFLFSSSPPMGLMAIVWAVCLGMFDAIYLHVGDVAAAQARLVELAEEEKEERAVMLRALQRIAESLEGLEAPAVDRVPARRPVKAPTDAAFDAAIAAELRR